MTRSLACLFALVALTSPLAAQEADYSEDRVAPSRVPPSFRKAAEKEAPNVRFSSVFKDNEKGYRFVGKGSDGRTYSVRVDREGAVEWRRIYADVVGAKLPKPVAATLREEIGKSNDLAGFKPERTSLVERYDARKKQTETLYEIFGHTPGNRHPRFEIEPSGKLVRIDTSFIPNTGDFTRRETLTSKEVPPAVLRGITSAAPGIKIARVDRLTTKTLPDPTYEAFGKAERGRGVEVTTTGNGQPTVIAMTIPLREVPRAALAAVENEARTDKKLAHFKPVEARIRRVVALEQDQIELFGDDPDGEPLDVTIYPDGHVLAMPDVNEAVREEAGISVREPRPKDAVAARGFSVLAARYGIDHHWNDETDALREAAEAGRKEFKPGDLPDPAFGRHKTLVMMYSYDGKVGLSEIIDDEPMPLDARQDPSTLAPIPPRGFAVLAARFGTEGKWEDVTDAIKAKVANGRLDFKPTEAGLPGAAEGEPKALAVAYSKDGKPGLYVQSQWRSPCLPPDIAPINSGSLLARSLEFPDWTCNVEFTPDSRNVVVGVKDGSIRLIEAASGREVRRFDGDKPGWHPVAVSGNGAMIVSGDVEGAIRIWDVKTGKEKALLRGHTEGIRRIAFSPTNRLVASDSWDHTVRLWDVASGRELRKLEGNSDLVEGIKFTPDGRRVVAASPDKTARVWDANTGRELFKMEAPEPLGDVGLSKSGREVFLGSRDGLLRRWEPGSGRDPVSINTYADCEPACDPLPDGHRVLVADKIAAAMWDMKTGNPILRLEKHIGRVVGLAVSPDGKRAASCSEDRTLKIWNLPDLGK